MIDYTYDPLYRLTAADYSSGAYYHYTYDANGNRLSEQSHLGSHSYTYDSARPPCRVPGDAVEIHRVDFYRRKGVTGYSGLINRD